MMVGHPLYAGTREASVEPVTFRAMMRHQACAVSIIAAGAPGRRFGLTATAASSLSDNPPALLVCVNRKAGAHDVIVDCGCFSLNVLSADQTKLAQAFSGRSDLHGEARFIAGKWGTLNTGAPVLPGALINIDCELAGHHTFETHSIFVGHVVAMASRESASPLLYFRGNYFDLNSGAITTTS
jgi:flavin reductase (DIM6/NTAB) family NADH-FMN oxidoreductase RutF